MYAASFNEVIVLLLIPKYWTVVDPSLAYLIAGSLLKILIDDAVVFAYSRFDCG